MGPPYLGHGLHILANAKVCILGRHGTWLAERGRSTVNTVLSKALRKAILMRTSRHSSGYPPDKVISVSTAHALTRNCCRLSGNHEVPTLHRTIRLIISYKESATEPDESSLHPLFP